MKALHFNSHGSFDALKFGSVSDPKITDDHALIRVRACAMNHLDVWVLKGWPELKLPMPHIGGSDIAGEIVELPKKAFGWRTGDRVVVCPGYVIGEDEWTRSGEESVSPNYRVIGESSWGGFAEYAAVPLKNLVALPKDFSFSEGAAPLLVGTTAWRMFKHRVRLQSGETVLIVGAGGGVNSFSVQLAKFFGAKVVALTSTEAKMANARALGADHVLNYTTNPDWSREVRSLTNGRGVDVVVDNVGSKTIVQSIRSARRGGRIVTVGNTSGPVVTFDNRLIFTKQLSILGSTMGSAQDFKEMLEQSIWTKKVRPVIDSEIPLAEGRFGYEKLERGEQFGKVILIP
ncbi:zinc-binding dehydrogenase [bacterium]|nr:zinc-binding dehydrogenase [bacterium]